MPIGRFRSRSRRFWSIQHAVDPQRLCKPGALKAFFFESPTLTPNPLARPVFAIGEDEKWSPRSRKGCEAKFQSMASQ